MFAPFMGLHFMTNMVALPLKFVIIGPPQSKDNCEGKMLADRLKNCLHVVFFILDNCNVCDENEHLYCGQV
jgi:hypothetical protein